MKTRILSLLALFVYCAISHVSAQEEIRLGIPPDPPNLNPGKLLVVKSTGDSVDAAPGDGVCADAGGNCTLRAAVDESNANNAPADVIIFELAYPAVIELTLGHLTVSDTATSIIGPGARRLTIRRSPSAAVPFRIFNLTNAEERNFTRIWRLRVEGGVAGSFIPGGGVRVAPGASVDMVEMWFAGNSGGNGGAIFNEGTLNITRSLFAGNSASLEGGALYLAAGSTTVMTNSTITSNTAANGGAVYAAGSLLSANNTITHNSASSSASSIASAAGSSVSTMNTIIGADTSLPITTLSGTFNSLGNNLITDARTATGFTNGLNNDQVSDNNAIDPLLGALADNGGQTDTQPLLVGSPAIDQGNSCVYLGQCSVMIPRLRWDQRTGHSRMALSGGSIVDIGAFESGNTVTNGGAGIIGGFFPNPAPRNIGFVYAIDVTTGVRQTAIVRPRGGYRFSNLRTGEVYVFDHHIKNRPIGPFVVSFQF